MPERWIIISVLHFASLSDAQESRTQDTLLNCRRLFKPTMPACITDHLPDGTQTFSASSKIAWPCFIQQHRPRTCVRRRPDRVDSGPNADPPRPVLLPLLIASGFHYKAFWRASSSSRNSKSYQPTCNLKSGLPILVNLAVSLSTFTPDTTNVPWCPCAFTRSPTFGTGLCVMRHSIRRNAAPPNTTSPCGNFKLHHCRNAGTGPTCVTPLFLASMSDAKTIRHSRLFVLCRDDSPKGRELSYGNVREQTGAVPDS